MKVHVLLFGEEIVDIFSNKKLAWKKAVKEWESESEDYKKANPFPRHYDVVEYEVNNGNN